jgi:hypothetical protein
MIIDDLFAPPKGGIVDGGHILHLFYKILIWLAAPKVRENFFLPGSQRSRQAIQWGREGQRWPFRLGIKIILAAAVFVDVNLQYLKDLNWKLLFRR